MTSSHTAPLLLILISVLLSASIAACADDASYVFPARTGPRSGDDNPKAGTDTSTTVPDGAEQPAAEQTDNDGGGAPALDAALPVTAFSNTSAYALLTPAKQSGDHHGGVSHAGEDCLLCHTGQGAPQFAAAGTVFSTKSQAGGGATAVQVRIVNPAGEEIALVGTDDAGNFWLKSTTTTIPPGSRVGVRDGLRTKLMGAAVGTGACNQSGCHVATRPIYLSD